MGRYLVTGGSGFIGNAVVRRLIRDGHEVVCIDNNLRGGSHRLSGIGERLIYAQSDVRDTATLQQHARGCDTVIHLASINGTENFYREPELVLDVGVRGILSVIDACRATGIRRLLLASSSEVYQTPPLVPTPETVPLVIPDPLNPRYSYAAQKLISEVVLLNYALTGFDHAVIVRPHNVYGSDMGWGHVIPAFVVRLAALMQSRPPDTTIPFEIQGDGSQTRAFCHIDDFVDGLLLALDKGSHRGIYHVGTEEEVTIASLAERIAGCLGQTVHLVARPLLQGSPSRRCPAIGKMRALGYNPQIPLDVGLPPVVRWYFEHKDRMPLSGTLV
jgi:dTDP-glucose 4,6-dehydratase/UDP-glucose 4-epimerase